MHNEQYGIALTSYIYIYVLHRRLNEEGQTQQMDEESLLMAIAT